MEYRQTSADVLSSHHSATRRWNAGAGSSDPIFRYQGPYFSIVGYGRDCAGLSYRWLIDPFQIENALETVDSVSDRSREGGSSSVFRPSKLVDFVGTPWGDGAKGMFLFGRNPRISIWCEQAAHRRKCGLVDGLPARHFFQKPVPVAGIYLAKGSLNRLRL